MSRYVDEELRHQTAMRAAFSASTGEAPFASWNELKREVLRLMREALPQQAETAAAAIEGSFVSPDITASGGPILPPRRVRPVKGVREIGDRHEVVACDPILPKEVWTTRCGWRFAGSPHVISGEGGNYLRTVPAACTIGRGGPAAGKDDPGPGGVTSDRRREIRLAV